MSEDTKQPDTTEPPKPDAPDSDASGSPAATLAGADAEKSAIVEGANSRVAAAKESLAAKVDTPAGTPKPPVKKKEEGPKPTDASGHPLVQKLRAKFGAAVGEASEFIGQLSINIRREDI